MRRCIYNASIIRLSAVMIQKSICICCIDYNIQLVEQIVCCSDVTCRTCDMTITWLWCIIHLRFGNVVRFAMQNMRHDNSMTLMSIEMRHVERATCRTCEMQNMYAVNLRYWTFIEMRLDMAQRSIDACSCIALIISRCSWLLVAIILIMWVSPGAHVVLFVSNKSLPPSVFVLNLS